jgi:hypothetical protein
MFGEVSVVLLSKQFPFSLISPSVADISLAALDISPSQALVGDKVTITLTFDNAGGKGGTYPVQLYIDGIDELVKDITVSPRVNQEAIFEVTRQFSND